MYYTSEIFDMISPLVGSFRFHSLFQKKKKTALRNCPEERPYFDPLKRTGTRDPPVT